jgi:uncharacterized protein with HEPN domain
LPFDNEVSALRNTADAIDSIQQFTEGMDFEAFRQDLKKQCNCVSLPETS